MIQSESLIYFKVLQDRDCARGHFICSPHCVESGRDSLQRYCYDAETMKVFLAHAHDDAPLATHISRALAESGLDVWDPDHDLFPGDNWASEVARALEEYQAMVVLLTPAAASSPDVKRNIEYALGAKNYSNRLIPVVIGGREHFPAAEVPWIVRGMPWVELDDAENELPRVEPIAEAILSHA